MMPDGRLALNDYQQLMVRLNTLSPYSAVHSVAIKDENTSIDLLQHSINHVVNHLGLGYPQFSSDNQCVTFLPIQHMLKLETRQLSLHEHTELEMNHVFMPQDLPLRFFIIADQSTLYFSITYNHWVADAYAISRLIESIFAHMRQNKQPTLTLAAPKMDECFTPIYGKLAFYHRYLTVIQSALRFSRAFRTPVSHVERTESSNCAYVFDKATLERLSKWCKTENITLNDFFLAILAQLFGEMTQHKRAMMKRKWFKPKRDRIIIAVISNIRNQSHLPLSNIFSLFLGFFYLSFKSPEHIPFRILCQRIRSQTKRLKNNNMAVKQSLLFKVQNFLLDRKKNKLSQYRLFSKNTPITVGISNMDLRHTAASLQHEASQYIRFSPTAMVCPIVFNLTTFNDHLSLGINFRKVCYTLDEVEQIKDNFVAAIHRLIFAEPVNHI